MASKSEPNSASALRLRYTTYRACAKRAPYFLYYVYQDPVLKYDALSYNAPVTASDARV